MTDLTPDEERMMRLLRIVVCDSYVISIDGITKDLAIPQDEAKRVIYSLRDKGKVHIDDYERGATVTVIRGDEHKKYSTSHGL